jgi:predicted NBD/HSP70 family sugar kinase
MYLLFDIGATSMRLSFSGDGIDVGTPKLVSTPQKFEDAMHLFAKVAQEISYNRKIEKCVGGIRGVLDSDKNKLVADVKLKDWINKPLKERLEKTCNAQVYLENDTAIVGLGEATVGVGKGYEIVVYITVSSGVGGVRIVNGNIDEGKIGFEPGHQVIDADGSIYPEAYKHGWVVGELESLVSGTAMMKRFGKKPYEITDTRIWDDVSRLVAVGLANTILHWSPDIIIVGGGMTKSPGIEVDKVEIYLKDYLKIFPTYPKIRKAVLGDFGGIHGALVYIQAMNK